MYELSYLQVSVLRCSLQSCVSGENSVDMALVPGNQFLNFDGVTVGRCFDQLLSGVA